MDCTACSNSQCNNCVKGRSVSISGTIVFSSLSCGCHCKGKFAGMSNDEFDNLTDAQHDNIIDN